MKVKKRNAIADQIVQDHKHLSSADITARRNTLCNERDRVDGEIARGAAALAAAKLRRSTLQAEIEGMGTILGAR